MRLLAHHLLLYCSEETQQFAVFSKWLRHEIDVQAAETPLNPAEEVEQDLNLDFSLLLAYIQGALETSKLDLLVKLEQDTLVIAATSSVYYEVKKALASFKAGEDFSEELINLGAYFEEWMRHNRTLVDQITSHQRASSSITSGLVLEEGDVLVSDIRMVHRKPQGLDSEHSSNQISTYTAVVHKKKPRQRKILRF
jgi:anaphase-promoting complex subunit 4